LSRSIAAIASSISLPMVGCFALPCRCDQRASLGTQKMLSARYSSWVLGVGAGIAIGHEGRVLLLEGVGDVLEEDESEDDVLVLGRVHVVAELVRHLPELRLEADHRVLLF
jgi:hypothetical protein